MLQQEAATHCPRCTCKGEQGHSPWHGRRRFQQCCRWFCFCAPPTYSTTRAQHVRMWGDGAHQPHAACAACAAAGSSGCECGSEPGSSEASHLHADEAWCEETDGDSAFDGEHSDSRDPSEPVQRRGELWAAKSVYPAGIASLLDEENLAAAREYECPCGNKCLSRVSFIDVYEFRKECVRYIHSPHFDL